VSRAAFLAFLAAFRSFMVIVGFLQFYFLTIRLFMVVPFRERILANAPSCAKGNLAANGPNGPSRSVSS
jgi:hypothetical protein